MSNLKVNKYRHGSWVHRDKQWKLILQALRKKTHKNKHYKKHKWCRHVIFNGRWYLIKATDEHKCSVLIKIDHYRCLVIQGHRFDQQEFVSVFPALQKSQSFWQSIASVDQSLEKSRVSPSLDLGL